MKLMQHREFEQLVLRQQATIERVCRRFFVGDRYRQQAVAQDVLLRLWNSFGTMRDEKACVYRVAVNTAIDHYHLLRQQQQRMVPLEGRDLCDEERPLQERLYELIDLLPEEEQELLFYYLDHRTEKEIAALTGLTESNVGVRIHRIKNKLIRINHEH